QPRLFTLGALDPSPIDQAAGFEYRVDWGDGTTSQDIARTAGNGVGPTLSHVYTAPGVYTVQVIATDKDGGVSAIASQQITITYAALEDDPTNPGTTLLAVGGTLGNDGILFRPSAAGIEAWLNQTWLGTFQPTSRLLAYGQAGDDLIRVNERIT